MAIATRATTSKGPQGESLGRSEKGADIRRQNINAATSVADTVRTSLGPKGMDKMIQDGKGGVVISNDGATILKEMSVVHPTARMLVELSKAQDVEAGDGTTSVVVIAGGLLSASQNLLDRGVHPQVIAEAFLECATKAEEVLKRISVPVNLSDRSELIKAATTSLSSKVVSQSAPLLAPMAVDAVLRVTDLPDATNVDLSLIRVVKKLGGTVDDSEMVDGLLFNQKVTRAAGGPSRIEGAKIGLIQFCLSVPKTDLENNIVIKDYQAMDRLLREERVITAKMVKAIAATGCNVLLVQKSILRDAVSDLAMDYLAKTKILLIKDIERDDVEFISRSLQCQPVASLDSFTKDKLGSTQLVMDETLQNGTHLTRLTGVPGKQTVTVLLRASNGLILDEAERSFHDAICVVRSLVKTRALLPGGAAPEIELSQKLAAWAREQTGVHQMCARAFAEALEVIPYTLAENAGLKPLKIVTELRRRHAEGDSRCGINVRKGCIGDMVEEQVVQPLLVTLSAVRLATETVICILKIDDMVLTR